MADVVPSEKGVLRITSGGVAVFAVTSLAGAALGAALVPKRPVLGAMVGTLGGMAVPVLLVVAVLAPLARAKAGAV